MSLKKCQILFDTFAIYICPILKGENVKLYLESFMMDQLDEALDLIKSKVNLTPGGTYQTTGFGVYVKKDLIEAKLGVKYVRLMI